MTDFNFSKLQVLRAEYGPGMPSQDEDAKIDATESQMEAMGGLSGYKAEKARIKLRNERALFLGDIAYQIRSQVLMEQPSHCGQFLDVDDYRKIFPIYSASELRDKSESFTLEAESFNEAAQLLKASVFPEDAEQQLETKGFVVIKVAHRGYSAGDIVRETDYRKLAKLTLEKLSLLDVVAAFYAQLHKMCLAELKQRETDAPAAVKTLVENAKKLLKEGFRRKKALEAACLKYSIEKTSDNRNTIVSARDIFNALQAQYADLYYMLFKIDTHAKLQEFSTLSDEAWHVLHQV
jgi:hypothetical protein